MKSNELRIGNYINDIKLGSGYVEWITLQEGLYVAHVRLFKSVEEESGVQTWSIEDWVENFKPIPLTEEWLKKFGFKKVNPGIGGQDNWAGMLAWSINGEWLFRGKPNELILVGYFNTRIKYVHSLQNLYFALTGKELEIK